MLKGHAKWGLVAVCCVLLLAGCASHGPAAVAKSFYQAIAAKKIDKAVDMISFKGAKSSDMAAAKSKVKVALGFVEAKIESKGGLKSVEIKKVEKIDKTHAKVNVVLHFGNGDSQNGKVKTVHEDGKWLVQMK